MMDALASSSHPGVHAAESTRSRSKPSGVGRRHGGARARAYAYGDEAARVEPQPASRPARRGETKTTGPEIVNERAATTKTFTVS